MVFVIFTYGCCITCGGIGRLYIFMYIWMEIQYIYIYISVYISLAVIVFVLCLYETNMFALLLSFYLSLSGSSAHTLDQCCQQISKKCLHTKYKNLFVCPNVIRESIFVRNLCINVFLNFYFFMSKTIMSYWINQNQQYCILIC